MKDLVLGYYYHSPFREIDGRRFVFSMFGHFYKDLGNQVKKLVLFLHRDQTSTEEDIYDFEVPETNIEIVDLGPKQSTFSRFIYPGPVIEIINQNSQSFDALIVRGPTPLEPAFSRLRNSFPIFHLIVGDYLESAKQNFGFGGRKVLGSCLLYWIDRNIKKSLESQFVFFNNPSLPQVYKKKKGSYRIIYSNQLTRQDVFQKELKENEDSICLLFVGRISEEKGLGVLLNSINTLIKKDYNISLRIVGWDDSRGQKYTAQLMNYLRSKGIEDAVKFVGFLKWGPDLWKEYRDASILVLPSFHEGFPRVIYEAFSQSLPVITTKVGSIPHLLSHMDNAYLISSKNENELNKGIIELSKNVGLRKELVKNGHEFLNGKFREDSIEELVNEIVKQIAD